MAITYTPAVAPLGAVTIHRIVSAVTNLLDTVSDWNDARRTVAALNQLTAVQLDDIGLSRGDIGRKRF